MVLILEHACRFYALEYQCDINKALDEAYSKYTSDTHNLMINQFSAPLIQYSNDEITEFILNNHF
jgi:hypothetical protein